jgi:trans-2,3-dihydro-3-hydroxyanthranilate isomerase
MVPVATRRAVDSASLDVTAYEALGRAANSGQLPVFFFTTEKAGDGATAYSRMFAPGLGITEDAATGSASGPLGCYLVRHKLVPPEKAGSILSLQGVKMGRPSHIHVAIGVEGDEIVSVRVGGEAVLAGEGVLYV